jgi:predicted transcriptional regulator
MSGMVRRVLVLAFVALLFAGVFTPGAGATTASVDGTALSAGDGIDTPVLDRLRPAAYGAIEASPGTDLDSIATSVGVTKSTVRYHVGVLREADLVAATEVAGSLRFAPAETNVELAGILEAEATSAVLTAVAANEPASVRTVATAADRAPSTASYHLSSLEERGFVERERRGEAVVTMLSERTRSAIEDGLLTTEE